MILKSAYKLLLPVTITIVLLFFLIGNTVAMVLCRQFEPIFLVLDLAAILIIFAVWQTKLEYKRLTGKW